MEQNSPAGWHRRTITLSSVDCGGWHDQCYGTAVVASTSIAVDLYNSCHSGLLHQAMRQQEGHSVNACEQSFGRCSDAISWIRINQPKCVKHAA